MMRAYLERHIDLDEDSHAPMGRDLMKRICGADRTKWVAAASITCRSLEMRHRLWNGVLEELKSRSFPNLGSVRTNFP